MKFVVGDDHQVYCAGLVYVLENVFEGCEVISARTYTEVASLVAADVGADLFLIDLLMPGLTEDITLKQICGDLDPVPVVILSGSEDSHHIRVAMDSGARGYLFKTMTNEQIALAIRMVLSGQIYLPAHFSAENLMGDTEAQEGVEGLPKRQREVFALIMDGKGNKEIAATLQISISTVKNHIALIMRRLNVSNRQEMMVRFRDR